MVSHPLMKPAAWRLVPGAGAIVLVRQAGGAFWLVGGLVMLLWLGGLLHEALVWGMSPLLLLSGVSVALGWSWLAWSSWRSWRQEQPPLTLLWTGGGAEGVPQGFRVAQWGAFARVELVFDLQNWMLLRVTQQGQGSRRQAWIWLDASKAQQPDGAAALGASMHQLRTLLHMPPNMQAMTGGRSPSHGGVRGRGTPKVASWAHLFKSGIKLRSSAPLSRMSSTQSPAVSGSVFRGLDSSFPSTLVMRDDTGLDQSSSQPGERV